ncbi:MAG TPA: BON domain-containing protein [Polyangiaceae bacterium]|nr:BON domain-containing protein [Polyangiaceae bacterium]
MAGYDRNRRYEEGRQGFSGRDDEWRRGEGRYQRPLTDRGGWSEHPESERGYASDQVYGPDYDRDARDSGRWPERDRQRFSNEQEQNRWRQTNTERERGYSAGVSGDYFTRETREPGNRPYLGRGFDDERFGSGQAGYGHEYAPREGRSAVRYLGLGGLQAGGFGTYEVHGGEVSSGLGHGRSAAERSGATQSFYGRGPKGYTRSDDRIREDVSERLYADDHVDASEITITVESGEVTLSGTVETRRMKHSAEDIADSVSGVQDVHNHLRVTRGVMSRLAEKVQHGVEKLTGSESKSESFRTSADPSTRANNRHHS